MKKTSLVGVLLLGCVSGLSAAPPFRGTVWLHPSIIVESDPTAFEAIEYAGRGQRTMFDRRLGAGDDSQGSGDWVSLNAYLFDATYDDGRYIEVQVNPEFGSAATAEGQAAHYALTIGQLPSALRKRIETVWIHKGDFRWGGGNDNILIHVGKAPEYLASGVLEEVLMHEAVHTSLDPDYRTTAAWLAAQAADPGFISVYARDYPETEDMAESFGPFFAAEYRADRIPAAMAKTIRDTIPNRIAYFKSLNLDMWPVAGRGPEPEPQPEFDPTSCPDDALCFHEGSFRVQTTWKAGDDSGAARPRALEGLDGGLFSFFGPENPELLVKVLDGCGVNGHYWVYLAAATDVEFEVRVTRHDGASKVYRHGGGQLAPAQGDTGAFRCE
ncbi:MAG: hypothetical protein F4Z19_10935 [Holophagales bacterium]|nr:hypothetical protein [Holophagales bacterium]